MKEVNMKTNNFNQIEEILEDKIVFNDRNSLNEYINSTIARNKNSITHAFNYANDDE